MRRRILLLCFTLAAAVVAAESGAELFQKALTAEQAAGNLEEAIKLYQRVAKDFAADRALAAKALVQEARCYEKLGKGNVQAVSVADRHTAVDVCGPDSRVFQATSGRTLARPAQPGHDRNPADGRRRLEASAFRRRYADSVHAGRKVGALS